jgi:hypothetical protein
MSNQEFENYLRLIGKLLQLSRRQQEQIGAELQDHLESRVADLVDLGMDQQAAISQALEEFGDAAVMAKNFQTVSQLKRRRWMMRFATFSIAGCFLAAVLAVALWPTQSRFGGPDRLTANSFQDEALVAQADTPSPDGLPINAELKSTHAQADSFANSVIDINEHIERTLKATTDMDYQDVEWSLIQKDLFDRFKFNILTDQTALDDKLTQEHPLSLQVRGLPLEVCLLELLRPRNATFIVKDGAVRVISIDNVEDPQFLTRRTYDCRKLIEAMDLEMSSSLFRSLDTQKQDKSSVDKQAVQITSKEDFLIQLVSIMVGECDKWSTEGDGVFSISVVNGFLVVGAPREIHRETELFLKTLERTMFQ